MSPRRWVRRPNPPDPQTLLSSSQNRLMAELLELARGGRLYMQGFRESLAEVVGALSPWTGAASGGTKTAAEILRNDWWGSRKWVAPSALEPEIREAIGATEAAFEELMLTLPGTLAARSAAATYWRHGIVRVLRVAGLDDLEGPLRVVAGAAHAGPGLRLRGPARTDEDG